jgi:hypothetical protein
MADDRIDWADVAAVGIVARDYASEANDHPVTFMIGSDLRGSVPLALEVAAALREAYEAGRIEAQSSTNRSLRREVAAWNAVARWLRGQEEVGLFVLDDGRFGVFFTGNISCAPDDWYPSIHALAEALGLEVEE